MKPFKIDRKIEITSQVEAFLAEYSYIEGYSDIQFEPDLNMITFHCRRCHVFISDFKKVNSICVVSDAYGYCYVMITL
jgi:hypothetical protein